MFQKSKMKCQVINVIYFKFLSKKEYENRVLLRNKNSRINSYEVFLFYKEN